MNERRIIDALEFMGIYEPNSSYRQGSYITHPCPFASETHRSGVDRNPSFGIAIIEDNYSFYNCLSCKQKGLFYMLPDTLARVVGKDRAGDPLGVTELLSMELESLTEPTFKKVIEEKEKPKPLNKAVYETMYEPAWENEEARGYLLDRRISQATCEKIGIQFDEREMRVIFPVYGYDKELYGFTGRTILRNWQDFHDPKNGRIYPKVKDYAGLQKKHFMLGEHLIESNKPIMVVEGLFGYAHLIEIGADIEFSIVALLGSDLSEEKAKTLISSGNAIYLLLDNDPAGEVGIFGKDNVKGALHHLINYAVVFVPAWPEGKEDPDELTKEDIANLVNLTYPYVIH